MDDIKARWSLPRSGLVLIAVATCLGWNAKAESDIEQHSAVHAPHSFLLPKGIPDLPGSYNLQLSPFLQQKNGSPQADLGGHASVGMFDWGGVHLRSLGIKTTSTLEVIGMTALWRDQARKQGISMIAILGIPTQTSSGVSGNANDGDEHHGSWGYLLGLTGRWVYSEDFMWDGILHYDFMAKHLIPESGLVFKTWGSLFTTLDLRATLGSEPTASILPGIKYAIIPSLFLGAGYNAAFGAASKFDRQFYLQVEMGRH